MTYEDFFPRSDVLTYKRVKRGTMLIARIAREVVAEMVGGELPPRGGRNGKDFLVTPLGRYRLSMSDNSDNTTEQSAHDRMRVQTVVMGDEESLGSFLETHGLQKHDTFIFKATVELRLEEEL